MFRLWNVIKPFRHYKLNQAINAKLAPQESYSSKVGQNTAPIKVVSKAELIDLLKKPNVVLFDVRNSDEVKSGKIPTAVNIPCNLLSFENSMSDSKCF